MRVSAAVALVAAIGIAFALACRKPEAVTPSQPAREQAGEQAREDSRPAAAAIVG
jgi:hypothetical protein